MPFHVERPSSEGQEISRSADTDFRGSLAAARPATSRIALIISADCVSESSSRGIDGGGYGGEPVPRGGTYR